MDADKGARRLAADALAAEDPTGWFEKLYAAADAGAAVVPWDREAPHPLIAGWTEATRVDGAGRSALVVGSGLGADAEHFARLGFDTTAFDVAPTAIETARRRFPDSRVRYLVADLLDPPAEWREAFDLVIESLTVQSLPDPPRADAIARVGGMVAPGGTLLVVATAREEGASASGPPWPLTRAEIDSFATADLQPIRVEDIRESDVPRRWRAEFRRQ